MAPRGRGSFCAQGFGSLLHTAAPEPLLLGVGHQRSHGPPRGQASDPLGLRVRPEPLGHSTALWGERACPYRLLSPPWPELPRCPAAPRWESLNLLLFSLCYRALIWSLCRPEARVSPWQPCASPARQLTRASETGGQAFHQPGGQSFFSAHDALPSPQPLIPLPLPRPSVSTPVHPETPPEESIGPLPGGLKS